MFSLVVFLEALLLSASLSMDAFTAGFAYGSNKIKIPFKSVQVINVIGVIILGISLLIGSVIKQYINSNITIIICFVILFILGILKLLDSITKAIIRKYNNFNKEIKFSIFSFKFILNLYANPEEADVDSSKTISSREAVSVAIALSLDSMAVGLGAALGNVNGIALVCSSFITGMIAIILGCYLGNKIAEKMELDLSWISGVILILLAFSKIM